MTKTTDDLITKLAELGVQLGNMGIVLQRFDEIINGTSKTGGLKERIAIAEKDIEANKQSFKTINDNITQLRNEMLVEVGNLARKVDEAKPKGLINWGSVLQAAITAIVVGVVVVLFWKVIIPALAANPAG